MSTWPSEVLAPFCHLSAQLSDHYVEALTERNLPVEEYALQASVTLRFAALSCKILLIKDGLNDDVNSILAAWLDGADHMSSAIPMSD